MCFRGIFGNSKAPDAGPQMKYKWLSQNELGKQPSTPVCILMATYNGAAYLECQLESIQNQTFQNWELLIRDDGSTDATTEIIDRYCKNDPRIKRIDRHKP